MPDSDIAGLTEDTTPASTDNIYAQDAAGAVDKRVPLSALSTVTTTATTVNAAGAVMESDASTASMSFVVDEDAMTSNSATKVPTQQSTKAYVDNEIVALDEIAAGVRTTLDTGTPGFIGVDVDLASGISGGDTLTGGTGSGDDLTLASTAHATRGTIFVRDEAQLLSEDKSHSGTSALVALAIPSTRTLTFSDATALNPGNSFTMVAVQPVLVFDENSSIFGAMALFTEAPTLKNVNGEARTIYAAYGLLANPTLTADGAAVTFSSHAAVSDSPTVGVVNAGTATATAIYSLVSGLTVNTGGTVTTRRGIHFLDSTGAGAVTTAIAVDIAALSDATTSIGIRNASTTVLTPLANTNITATSATIRNDASLVTLTADNSYTLASTPTIADGQNGQVLKIMNVDTADTITLQDQGTLASSNLRLSANTVALGPRDSIELTYSSVVGDWVQTGQVNVL